MNQWGSTMFRRNVRPYLFVLLATAAGLLVGGGLTSPGAASFGRSAHVMHGAEAFAAAPAKTGGVVRTYYIAAEEVLWDFAPDDSNNVTGDAFTEDENVFVQNGPSRIGDTYRKALYRAYTDATFQTPAALPPSEEHLGMLGPVIRAEVGDTIKVVFRNNTSIPASIHPHGVFYTKGNEGAPYADGTTGTTAPGRARWTAAR
jgi:FtsP/CotA-like multicopper oxidase with cupredoxin domain